MHYKIAPAVLKGQLEKVAVPRGDPAEQIVANLLLSLLAFHLQSDSVAEHRVAEARDLARGLVDRYVTYRLPQASRFARLTCEQGGITEILLFSIIGDVLVLPSIQSDAIRHGGGTIASMVNVVNFDIAYFMLRLRPRKILQALEALKKSALDMKSAERVAEIIDECLHQEIPSSEPLDRASDSFVVAHNLIGKANFPLASLALRNADSALDLFVKTSSLEHHPPVVQTMKDQIKQLLGEMRQTAM